MCNFVKEIKPDEDFQFDMARFTEDRQKLMDVFIKFRQKVMNILTKVIRHG